MSDTPRSTSPPVDPGPLSSAGALTRAALTAILHGRGLSRAELVQAADAAPEDVDPLVGRALIFDDDDHIVAAHGLSLVPARQHRLTMRGCCGCAWGSAQRGVVERGRPA